MLGTVVDVCFIGKYLIVRVDNIADEMSLHFQNMEGSHCIDPQGVMTNFDFPKGTEVNVWKKNDGNYYFSKVSE